MVTTSKDEHRVALLQTAELQTFARDKLAELWAHADTVSCISLYLLLSLTPTRQADRCAHTGPHPSLWAHASTAPPTPVPHLALAHTNQTG